jgi:hypothetical protein
MITPILKRTIIPFVLIFGHCRITTMLNIFEQDILKWSLYIDFAILNIEIITFNSDPTTAATTEQQTITNETTTMGTNDDSKYSAIKIIIGVAGLATGVLIVIITIIVCVRRRRKIKAKNRRASMPVYYETKK